MKYGKVKLGQVESVYNKLGGVEGVQRFLAGELMVIEVPVFADWRTVRLGVGPSNAEGFRRALAEKDCKIEKWGNDILGKPAFSVGGKGRCLSLVLTSNAELGFKAAPKLADTLREAKKHGLVLCPPEVAPQLCLQCEDLLPGDLLTIAMRPITDCNRNLAMFTVKAGEDGRRYLNATFADPQSFVDINRHLVFARK